MVQQMVAPMQDVPNERLLKEEIIYTAKAAGFWMRFWAFLLDLLVIGAITGILVKPVFRIAGLSLADDVWYAPISILSAIVYFSYFVFMTKFFAQTVGKMVFGIKVVKDNGEKLDWMTVLFRELVGRFISNTFFKIPYLIVIFTPRHKGVHDFVADTLVVHETVYEQVHETKYVQLNSATQSIEQQQPDQLDEEAKVISTEKENVEQLKESEMNVQMQDTENKDEK